MSLSCLCSVCPRGQSCAFVCLSVGLCVYGVHTVRVCPLASLIQFTSDFQIRVISVLLHDRTFSLSFLLQGRSKGYSHRIVVRSFLVVSLCRYKVKIMSTSTAHCTSPFRNDSNVQPLFTFFSH